MAKQQKPKKVTKNESIFPATQLTAAALKWKAAVAKKRHKEAMDLLDEIIRGCTPMFERLAQYEGFHNTVDLQTLVSSAQDKVVVWLEAWKPSKGRLFSWTSKCLSGNTKVIMEDGSAETIEHLVNTRSKKRVLSYNEKTGAVEPKRIVNWNVDPASRKEFRLLKLNHPVYRTNGRRYSAPTYITGDHKVLTQRGWVEVDALVSSDSIIREHRQLSDYGKQALVGIYLGDGSVANNGYFSVGHGSPQRDYTVFLAEKFQTTFDTIKDGTSYYNKFVGRSMDHSGGTRLYVPLYSLWNEAIGQLWESGISRAKKKRVTPWILSQITPVSLAFWYMDDGTHAYSTGDTHLCTQGFTHEDRAALIKMLLERFNIHAHERKNNSIAIEARSRDTFFSLISPHTIKFFDYKFGKFKNWTKIPKINEDFIVSKAEHAKHASIARKTEHCWSIKKRFKLDKRAYNQPDLSKKYDIEVEGNHNFLINSGRMCVHNCAKNAFRSEVVKVVQYRKKTHTTGDNLEKFYGFDDHEVDKHDAEKSVREKIQAITCRWGDPQEHGALRYFIESIMDHENHDKDAAIKAVCFAWGISPDLSKFFYKWVLAALRDALHEQVRVPMTDMDLFTACYSYTNLPDLLQIITWDQFKRIVLVHGGDRFKIPTVAHMAQLRENYELQQEIQRSSLDPDAIAAIAKKRKKSVRTAQETYEDLTNTLSPMRAGEHYVYQQHTNTGHGNFED